MDAAQPAQQAVGNEGQQHTNVAIWSLDDAARLIAVLRQSERQGRMSHTTVCRLQGPPPSLTLTVNLPQTSQIVDRALSGAQFAETGESEHGGSDDVEVEPEPESMIGARRAALVADDAKIAKLRPVLGQVVLAYMARM